MKIRVTTGKYAYQGLYKDSEHDIGVFITKMGSVEEVYFTHHGKKWALTKEDFEVVDVNPAERSTIQDSKDMVNSPSHYALFDDIEAIQVIASSMTKEMFKGYCFGNLLKYKLRAGGKDDIQQELKKADKYKELYEKYQNLCK